MLDTRALFRQFYPSGLREVYVSESGQDGNDGTAALPYRTIQKAIDAASPGDRIIVAAGTYGYTTFHSKSGDAQAYVTIEGQPGAVVDVSDGTSDGIDIQASQFVAIYGLEVRGLQTGEDTNPSGIAIFRGSHHVAVWACHVHDFPGGGINCFHSATENIGGVDYPAGGWDLVDLFFNTIHATSRYSPFNTSGVSFYGAVDYTGSMWDGRYGYRAVGNHIYDVLCTVPYTPGGFDDVTDGNGISCDSLSVPNNLYPDLVPYMKRGLVEGNLIAACGGRGVHVYNTENVDVVHNTLVGNLRTDSPNINGSTEVDAHYDAATPLNGVSIVGNVLLPMNTPNTLDPVAENVTGNVILGGVDTVTAGNVDARNGAAGWYVTAPTEAGMIAGGIPVPVLESTAARPTGALGYQVVGEGGRGPVTWAAGAQELPRPVSPLMALRDQ